MLIAENRKYWPKVGSATSHGLMRKIIQTQPMTPFVDSTTTLLRSVATLRAQLGLGISNNSPGFGGESPNVAGIAAATVVVAPASKVQVPIISAATSQPARNLWILLALLKVIIS
jgi:hypothetical protein